MDYATLVTLLTLPRQAGSRTREGFRHPSQGRHPFYSLLLFIFLSVMVSEKHMLRTRKSFLLSKTPAYPGDPGESYVRQGFQKSLSWLEPGLPRRNLGKVASLYKVSLSLRHSASQSPPISRV